MRDNMRMRRLVKSEWFQKLWPLGIAADQDAKLKFENTATGYRAAVAATAMTGHRGDRVLYDDPHSVEGALSDLQRNTVLRVFSETVTTRLNSPERSAIVVVMQRLHEQDLSGYILERELGYEHLCLPMEFEPERRCTTSIGFRDLRQDEGELRSRSASRPRWWRATSGRWASLAPPASSSSAPPPVAAACFRPSASCSSIIPRACSNR